MINVFNRRELVTTFSEEQKNGNRRMRWVRQG